jgi:ABC-type dipeptide/oligopeptide/nickel transport systems, permease components
MSDHPLPTRWLRLPRLAPARDGGTRRLVVCLVIVIAYALLAIFGPVVTGYNPITTYVQDRLLPPGSLLSNGSVALLGTDQVGRDILGQVFMGARVSMVAGIATLLLAGLIGITVGLLAGYFGGILDSILMRIADIQLAFPSILLAILIAAILGPSFFNLILVLAIANWVVFARVTRSQVLALKNREYVDAARTLGARNLYLIVRTIFPGCVAPLLVVATVEIGHVIVAEASLSFLGLGTPASLPSWGLTISDGRDYLIDAWWISTFPGIALALLVLTLGVLGDTIRDRLDPKLRSL